MATPSLLHGTYILVNGTTTYGSIANVSCDDGFISSVSMVTCLASEDWEEANCTAKGRNKNVRCKYFILHWLHQRHFIKILHTHKQTEISALTTRQTIIKLRKICAYIRNKIVLRVSIVSIAHMFSFRLRTAFVDCKWRIHFGNSK